MAVIQKCSLRAECTVCMGLCCYHIITRLLSLYHLMNTVSVLTDTLSANPQLAEEIRFDMRKFEEQQEREAEAKPAEQQQHAG